MDDETKRTTLCTRWGCLFACFLCSQKGCKNFCLKRTKNYKVRKYFFNQGKKMKKGTEEARTRRRRGGG